MKKNAINFLLLILLGNASLFSQDHTLKIFVSHESTNEPIAFANIWLSKVKKGGSTDINGSLTLHISNAFVSDTLVCSFIGFGRKMIPLNFKSNSNISISLTPTYHLLNEVVITPQEDFNLDAKKIVKEAIKKKSVINNYPQLDQNYLISYRELVQEDEVYTTLNEAIANVVYAPYPRKVSHKSAVRRFYKPENHQSVYSKRDKNKFRNYLLSWNCQYFRYYVAPEDRCYIIKARYSNNHSPQKIEARTAGGPIELLTMDKLKYRYDMLDPKVMKKYAYTVRDILLIDEKEIYAIGFKPKLNKTDKRFGYNKRINEALLSGTIFINKEDKAIVKFEAQLYAETRYKNNRSWQEFGDLNSVVVEYRKHANSKYHLDKIITEQKYSNVHSFGISHTLFRQLNILDVGVKINQAEVIAESKIANFSHSLRSVVTPPYEKSQWEKYEKFANYPRLTSSIISDLSKTSALDKQFFNNSIEN